MNNVKNNSKSDIKKYPDTKKNINLLWNKIPLPCLYPLSVKILSRLEIKFSLRDLPLSITPLTRTNKI